ncbi:MAG: beta strand repeat-containing protein [Gemmataceae bacterium]
MWPTLFQRWFACSNFASRSQTARRRTSFPRPLLEALEDRTLLSTYMVNTTADSGAGSLRQAILDAKAAATGTAANPDLIQFAIPTTDPSYNGTIGAFTIQPLSALPTVTDIVDINGYTQPGASPNTMAVGDNAVLNIVLSGSQAGAVDGLVLAGANSTVRGLVIDNFAEGSGIVLNGSGNDVVIGNFIGTDVTGESAAANNIGISVENQGGNIIGSASPADRNIISGNNSALPGTADGGTRPFNFGVDLGVRDVVQGNYIGIDKSGTSALANGTGIFGGNNDTIGGVTTIPGTGAGNVISGNTGYGLDLGSQNVVAGNLIGTTATGLAALGNAGGILGGSYNTIGGTTPGARNIISGNTGGGIQEPGVNISGPYNLIEGNFIGTDVTGITELGNPGGGIHIGSSYNTIGGTTAAARNIISNDFSGNPITVAQGGGQPPVLGNIVQGNYIGTDVTGTQALANNETGIVLGGGVYDTLIGGTVPGASNVICGKAESLIILTGEEGETDVPTNTLIQGNFIGTDKSGAVLLGDFGNAETGIYIVDANNTTIGGIVPGAGNTIAFNGGYGVYINSGSGNSILGNSIFANSPLGIFLNSANNANNNQAAPVLAGASTSGSSTTISGTLTSVANSTFRIEFFSNAGLDPAGNAEGQFYLGFTTVTTDGSGNATFTAANLAAIPAGEGYLTATATNQSTGDTSQFSTLASFTPASLSGIVWKDFNDDGQVDFGESGIPGVLIKLTGTDDLGHAVNLSQLTDADGAYVFLNLRPGSYYITETQPAGYLQGIDKVGTAGGSVVATDQFFVQLAQGFNGLNYNFGEQPASGAVQKGQTATIGFWNNKNGQALIRALNGGSGHQLGDWLAATLPNIFGVNAGSNDLAGQSNAAVAALFQQDFLQKGVKLDAQLLATALNVYVTNATLDSTKVATSYGFSVSGDGVGSATVNVGSSGDAFGVANNSVLTVMDLLLDANVQALNGVLYNGNATKRNEANTIFSAVNQAGDVG